MSHCARTRNVPYGVAEDGGGQVRELGVAEQAGRNAMFPREAGD